jgi:hypothetical protein
VKRDFFFSCITYRNYAKKNIWYREVAFNLRPYRHRALVTDEVKEQTMSYVRRSRIDRRSLSDRRVAHDLDYLSGGGIERRSWKERRSSAEQRKGWLRAEAWSSVDREFIKL